MDGVVVHGNIQPMGAPADDGEDEDAVTRVIMVTTTVVQIENHRKRGRSPQVKVKTKSNTDTHTEERLVVGPIPDSDGDLVTDAREAPLSNGETLENAVSANQGYMRILIAVLDAREATLISASSKKYVLQHVVHP